MLLVSSYILMLINSGRLGMFVHTRFTWLSIVTASLLFVISFVGVLHDAKFFYEKKLWKEFNIKDYVRTDIVIVIICIVVFFLPIRPLSVGIAQQRVADFNNVSASSEDISELYRRTNTNEFTLKEWAILLNDNPANEDLVGRKITVSGFIFDDGTDKENLFYVSRFRVICCVVDASPLGIPVEVSWREKFKENDWVAISGILEFAEIHGSRKLVIHPESVENIEVPNNPYIY